jgi:hypothetical protein
MRLYAAETGTPDGSIHKDGSLTAKKLLAGALVTFSGVVGWLYVENGISLDRGTETWPNIVMWDTQRVRENRGSQAVI